jgi:NADPH:quinone reductase-like Zn-dependent oxidoreductase
MHGGAHHAAQAHGADAMSPAAHSRSEVAVRRRGGPEVLELRTAPLHEPRGDQVLIEVDAAGVAFGDVMLRVGLRPKVALPAVPGYDVAGRVLATGPDAAVPIGTPVVAWTLGTGGYATHATVPAWAAVPYPARLDPARAVAVVLNYLTAYQLLHRSTAIGEGDAILIHGGAGGVGTALLQLARLAGATAYATASRSKHEIVRGLGGIPIDYRTTDVVDAVRDLSPGGVVAVYDPIGGASWRRSLQLLAPGGTLVGYGFSAATRGGRRHLPSTLRALAAMPRPRMLRLVRKAHSIAGYAITEIIPAHVNWYRRDLATLLALLAEGRIDPIIAGRLPLDRAVDAHRWLGERPPIGKLVLETRH